MPAFAPLTQRGGAQLPPAHSASRVHGRPAFAPATHCADGAACRAMRNTVSSASVVPKNVAAFVSVGSRCGSNSGGSLMPWSESDPRRDRSGIRTGTPRPSNASTVVLARSRRATGTASRVTRTPRQSMGTSRLPRVSTLKRRSSPRPASASRGSFVRRSLPTRHARSRSWPVARSRSAGTLAFTPSPISCAAGPGSPGGQTKQRRWRVSTRPSGRWLPTMPTNSSRS